MTRITAPTMSHGHSGGPAGAAGVAGLQKNQAGENLSFAQVFDLLAKDLPFAVGLLVAAMPRGDLQVVQPQRVSESLLKSYGRDFGIEDRVTWAVLTGRKPTSDSRVWEADELERSRFHQQFLRPNALAHVAGALVTNPIFEGYDGVLWVARTAEQGDFTDADLVSLGESAGDLSEALAEVRLSRRPKGWVGGQPWLHGLAGRLFVFDERLKQVLPTANPPGLDGVLHDHMIRQARTALEEQRSGGEVTDRALLPDSDGDLWTFHVKIMPSLPALGGGGPHAVLALQPQCADWAVVNAGDFAADPEISRLVPAMRFMQREFRTSPTLSDVARQVHLSPFHFHRRFTELMGLTPKHFLLECQINEAKTDLHGRTKPLPQIATDCGFAHQSHFTSRFKQSTGLTPTRWRRLAAQRSGPNA